VLEIVPSVVDQLTVRFGLFMTLAVNWTDAPEDTVVFAGATKTTIEGGVIVTAAEADLVGSARLAATTVVVVLAVTRGAA
jgi:hypothetical protein